MKLEYTKPMSMNQTSDYLISEKEGMSQVTWRVEGKNTYFGRIMCLFFNMDKMVGGMFEKGLSNLKNFSRKTLAVGADSRRSLRSLGMATYATSPKPLGPSPSCQPLSGVGHLYNLTSSDRFPTFASLTGNDHLRYIAKTTRAITVMPSHVVASGIFTT